MYFIVAKTCRSLKGIVTIEEKQRRFVFLHYCFMRLFGLITMKRFGKMPTGERLAKVRLSPNFKDGAFQNQSVTPQLTDGATYGKVMKEVLFGRPKRAAPSGEIPSMKTDLLNL